MQPEEAFFKLMRLGMRACDDCDVALDKAGWEAVYELARRHAVAAVVLDGVERLTIMQKPPQDLVWAWIVQVQQVEEANRRLNRTVVMVCDKFRRESMGTVLLKGQGLSVFYPGRCTGSRATSTCGWTPGGRRWWPTCGSIAPRPRWCTTTRTFPC